MPLTNSPIVETQDLILRGPNKVDIEPTIAFLQNEKRSIFFGALLNRGDAWRWFALNVGHWHIHGFGYFTIVTKKNEIAGLCGIWFPEGWPEPELGWVVFDNFEGKGIAHEAAQGVRSWAYSKLDFTTITSNIVPKNKRSIALAKKLNATFEKEYHNDNMGLCYMYRHPSPENINN
jgi:RimJ/RimL family protein N-acetyltransferase